MKSVHGSLLIGCILLGSSSAFLFPWWAKNVCSPTCTYVVCPFGFAETGCPRCQCAGNPCPVDKCQPGFRCVTRPSRCASVFRCPHVAVCVRDDTKVCQATCRKRCDFGFEEIGCPRCECAKNPCGANTCNSILETCTTAPHNCSTGISCPHQAKCLPKPHVRPRVCAGVCITKNCPFGFDEMGCPRCTCSPNPCREKRCGDGMICHAVPSLCQLRNRCPYKAECRDTACEEVCPTKRCPHGFLIQGCPRCTCAPNPCLGKTCDAGLVCFSEASSCRFRHNCHHEAVCRDNVCRATCPGKTCEFGFLSRGCPRCQCAANPCLGFNCPIGQGCTTERASCKWVSQCPRRPVCKSVCEERTSRSCPFGFLSRGCPRDTCAPNPCQNFKCPNNGICVSSTANCGFREGCPHTRRCQLPPACEQTCPHNCPFGLLSEGCPRCRCAPDPCLSARPCLFGTCTPAPGPCSFTSNCPYHAFCAAPCEDTCGRVCPYGYLNVGCPRCECAPDPCRIRCPHGSVCRTRPSGCTFKRGCPHIQVCQRINVGHRCLQPMDQGDRRCRRNILRFYYDPARRTCSRMSFTGCGGNHNIFTNFWTCYLTCFYIR